MISSLEDQNARLVHPHGVEAYVPNEWLEEPLRPGYAGHAYLPCKILNSDEPCRWHVVTWFRVNEDGTRSWRFEELLKNYGQSVDLLEAPQETP